MYVKRLRGIQKLAESCMFLRVVQYFGEPAGQAKIQRTSKNIQQYYTLKCLVRYLLSNCFDSEFCKHT